MITQNTQTFAEITTPVNPFPGLRPFEFDESHLFFGRDGQSEQLIAKLGQTRFLAVVGTSGSGKSSLVRAGLLPTLLGGFMSGAGSDWRVAIMRPGNDPVGNLAQALNAPDVFGSEIAENAAIQTAVTEATLRRGGLGLVDAVRQALMPKHENLLVIVDQFEEIFRFARVSQGKEYQNEAAAFVKLILEASRRRELPIYVVLTMRSDYLGDCSQFWDLPEAINESQYLIPRLTRDHLREAITGPVTVGGGKITPRLVNRLLNDVGDDQDQLPILQHALMRSWDEWKSKKHDHCKQPEGDAIDLCCYESIGGMSEALSRHADEAFDELPDDRHREVAERLFKCLTEKGLDNREIRRPIMLSEICEIVEADKKEVISVIESFRRRGKSFLTPPANVPLNAESLIDISHESLIRGWRRLRGWVDEEARSARIYRRLAETAALHRQGEAGLWHDPDLQLALKWREQSKPNQAWSRRYYTDLDLAMRFLDESREARDREADEKEQQRKREIRRTRWTAIIFALAFILSLAALIFANGQRVKANNVLKQLNVSFEETKIQRNEAVRQRQTAESAFRLAENNAHSAIVARKDAEASKSKAEAQARIAFENANKAQSATIHANEERKRAEEALKIVEEQDHAAPYFKAIMRGSKDSVVSAAFSPDGKKVVTASKDNTVRLWEVSTGRSLGVFIGHTDSLLSAKFSPDGSRIVTASADGTARVWETGTGQMLATLRGHSGPVTDALFSHDGKFIATASLDRTTRVWEASSGRSVSTLRGHESLISSIAFSPDGRYILTGSLDKTALLWEIKTGQIEQKLLGHTSDVESAAFSPDGIFIATASADKTARVWVAKTGEALHKLSGHTESVTNVLFSPDGKLLVTGSRDKTAMVWDIQTGRSINTLSGLTGLSSSLAFSPDGQYLVTANGGNTATIWEVIKGRIFRELRGHTSPVTSVAFSQDGKYVVTSGDRTVRVWEATSGFDFVTLAPEAEWVSRGPSDPSDTSLTFGGKDDDSRGFALWREDYYMEDGFVPPGKVLETHPKWVDNGVISGSFPAYTVQSGDRFLAKFGFLGNGQAGNVKIRLNYLEDGRSVQLASWTKAYDGKLLPLEVDLSSLVGRNVRFVLVTLANGSSGQDWATWINPRISRE